MKQVTVPLPELALIAATRAIGALGLGLLVSSLVPERRRRRLGWIMLGIGIGSTFPLVLDVLRRNPEIVCEEEAE